MRKSIIKGEAERLFRKHGMSAHEVAIQEVTKAKQQKNARLELYRSKVALLVAHLVEKQVEYEACFESAGQNGPRLQGSFGSNTTKR